jgi:hypothetical protein
VIYSAQEPTRKLGELKTRERRESSRASYRKSPLTVANLKMEGNQKETLLISHPCLQTS